MKIRNYTTSISAIKTITEIEQMLSENKATLIVKEYRGDNRVSAISFRIGEAGYKLPSNTEKVYQRLKEITYKSKFLTGVQKQKLEEQSERVAWRVIRDWLHAQLSLIYIGQAELEQVMLPYAYDGKRTYYEYIKDKGGIAGLLTNNEDLNDSLNEKEAENDE